MILTNRNLISVIAVLIVILLAGCGPHMKNTFRDDSFAPDRLKSSIIVVGDVGTMVLGETEDPEIQNRLVRLLRSTMVNQKPDMRVMPDSFFAGAVGDSSRKRLTTAFVKTGRLRDADLAILQNNMPDSVSLIVLVRFTEDKLFSDTYNPDATGKTNQITYFVTRRIKADFAVYDIRAKRLLWSSNISYKNHTKNDYDGDQGFFESIVNSVLSGEDNEDGYPDPPSIDSLSVPLFKCFVEKLAGDKKK